MAAAYVKVSLVVDGDICDRLFASIFHTETFTNRDIVLLYFELIDLYHAVVIAQHQYVYLTLLRVQLFKRECLDERDLF